MPKVNMEGCNGLDSYSSLPGGTWAETLQHLEALSWVEVYHYWNRTKSSCEDCHFSTHLKPYTEQRLRKAREEMKVLSAYHLDDKNFEQFFKRGSYFHQGLQKSLTLGEVYSLLKFGEHECSTLLADNLTDKIKQNNGGEILENPQNWVIAVPSGLPNAPGAAVKASHAFSREIASRLGIRVEPIWLDGKVQTWTYGSLDNALMRFDYAMNQYIPTTIKSNNVIVIDDAIVSGATVWATMASLSKSNSVPLVGCAVAVDVAMKELSVEAKLNEAAQFDDDTFSFVVADPRTTITSRTLMALLRCEMPRLRKIIGRCTAQRVQTILRIANASQSMVKELGPNAQEAIHQISNILKEM